MSSPLIFKELAALSNRGSSRNTTPLDDLIARLAKLPGFGPRSARRAALHLLKNRETALAALLSSLDATAREVATCETCGNYDTATPCHICTDATRDATTLCIVEDVDDLWALERSRVIRGRYHVLGGTLSALSGIGPDQLRISQMMARIAADGVTEVIVALGATVEGQTTAHYLSERLSPLGVNVTRPAQGMPLGGEVDYLDDGTLITAFKARRSI